MMRPNRHLIQRQVIEIGTSGFDGPGLQAALARTYRESGLPALERLFDGIAGPDDCLRLDRLEVDLGLLAGHDWESRFSRRLVEELTRALADLRAEPLARAATADGARSSVPLQQFLYFLVNGRLPWWGAKPTPGWTHMVPPAMNSAGWEDLLRLLRDDVRARTRCIDACTDDFLDEAIGRWAQLRHAASVCARLASQPTNRNGSVWRRTFWGVLFDWAASGAKAAEGPLLLRDLLASRRSFIAPGDSGGSESPPLAAESPTVSWDPTRSEPTAALKPDPWQELEGLALPEPWSEWAKSAARTPPAMAPQRSSTPRPDSLRPAFRRNAPSAETDPIYLSGAGAILLHPFLETLFRERALLTGRQFTDVRARDRAVHLIGLMTFGARAAEYDLLLAKLLCGCPCEDPVEPVELDEQDQAGCDALLRAVLRHWSVLRSDSPPWMRDQFLLREGKLEPIDAGWRLTVESRAQDVLLARLPWGFGVVSTPWSSEKIFVQWVD